MRCSSYASKFGLTNWLVSLVAIAAPVATMGTMGAIGVLGLVPGCSSGAGGGTAGGGGDGDGMGGAAGGGGQSTGGAGGKGGSAGSTGGQSGTAGASAGRGGNGQAGSGGQAGNGGRAGSGGSPSGGTGGNAGTPGTTGAAGAGPGSPGSALLAVGGGARRSFSVDGKTWSEASDLSTAPDGDNQYNLSAACYGNGLWVVISHQGWIWTSPDGRTWTQANPIQGFSPTSCAYGNGVFTAGITSNEQIDKGIRTSTNGTTWTESSFASRTRMILFAKGIFVLTSDAGLYTSTDGKSWTPNSGVSDGSDIAFGDGRFMVLSDGGHSVSESTDGLTWSKTTLSVSGIPDWGGAGLAHGAGRFFVLSDQVSFSRLDGQTTWTQVRAQWPGNPSSMGGNDQVIVVSTNGLFYWSTTGATWTVGTAGTRLISATVISNGGP